MTADKVFVERGEGTFFQCAAGGPPTGASGRCMMNTNGNTHRISTQIIRKASVNASVFACLTSSP